MTDTARELMQMDAGHYAVPTKSGWFIYMHVTGSAGRMVATRSSDAAALSLIRQRRDAYAQAEADTIRSCRAEVERIRDLYQPHPVPGAA